MDKEATMDSVHLSFETTLGDFEGDFAAEERVQAVKRRVMAGVRLDPEEADAFVLNLDERRSTTRRRLPTSASNRTPGSCWSGASESASRASSARREQWIGASPFL
jgi:hypothetical protein